MRLRLAELIAALSLATDLGLGLPQEHVLRQCRIALGLAERVGVEPAERAAVYYVAMLAWVGCTADSHELASRFGDEIALRADAHHTDLAGLPLMGFMLRRVGEGRPPLKRAQMAATLVATGGRGATEAMTAHCRVAAVFAQRLGLGPEVQQPLLHVFSRWDGKGLPKGTSGESLPPAIRLVHIASIAEVHHRVHGVDGAIAVTRERAGGQFDPRLAEAFADCAHDLLGQLADESSWDAVIAAEPALDTPLTEAALDGALEAVADFADLKSPWFTGHSRGVARLAAGAAQRAGLPEHAVMELKRAGLVHDLGRSGVPNTIWDKPGPLTDAERERVRLHPYYTERVLARPTALAGLGALAACHHERLDGSGYHRTLPGSALSPSARILAAADVYHAMTEARPHRPARTPEQAAVELREAARAGRIDADAAEDVLAAAGHATRGARERARPGGLTARELEVLLLVARGASSRDVARRLTIADKTARNHVERIYSKLGVSTRAEASLYAMRHGLIT
ncbi:HD domain-containing phosphohydrolase [Solirubrobacter soli]|uniref:HD domain-containing phosphohydrolase n=1 Tax=Solirubrobacter soli TaxID=363832 RepID=UPI00040B84BA|nr:HD domain-containing phosphohydrolase [Solirubrobacter soli]